uniref:RING finger protein 122 n=4 Tax=Salmoninae TaxID=504568 RepID=A0A8C7C192_ONCKI
MVSEVSCDMFSFMSLCCFDNLFHDNKLCATIYFSSQDACGLGLQHFEKYCGHSKMDTTYHLPLNVYVIVLGIGLFVFMLSLIFCCYLFRLKQQGTREQFSYNEVVLKGAGKKLSLLGQTCAVCLEEFRTRDELAVCPCSHAFHKKCLLKWLEIRSVCPMCNKPILRLHPDPTQGTEGPQDPEEV